MTPYAGIIKVHCRKKKNESCPRKLITDVEPECLSCPESLTQIMSLDDKIVFEYRPPREGQKEKNKRTSV